MLNSAVAALSAIPLANIASRAATNLTSFTQSTFSNLLSTNDDASTAIDSDDDVDSAGVENTRPDEQFLNGPANRRFASIRVSSKADSRDGKKLGGGLDSLIDGLKQFLQDASADPDSVVELQFNGTDTPTVRAEEPLATRVNHWLADRQASLIAE